MGYLHVGGTMSRVAPKGRKHLSADALFRLVRNGFAHILDDCAEEPGISLTDALMSAFAMFSLICPVQEYAECIYSEPKKAAPSAPNTPHI